MKKIILFIFLFTLSCKTEKKPNILLISLDALRASNLSSYGYERNTSPFIDYISKNGIIYLNFFVNTHGTFSSHSTILTGFYQESLYKGKYGTDFKVNPKVLMVQEYLKNYNYFTIGVTDGGLLSRSYGFDRGFFSVDDEGGGIEKGTEKLIKYIKKVKDKPLFIFYHTYEIHSPYKPPHKYKNLFGKYESQLNPTNEVLLKYVHTAWRDLKGEDLEFLKSQYDGSIKYVDDTLLVFFKRLERLGFFKNFLLLLTSDHGEEFGEHGGLLHRDNLYEELLHVPMVVAGTKVPKGKREYGLFCHIDIVPTILKYAKVPLPDFLMGKDLLSFSSHKFIFSQYEDRKYSLRTKRWKFILNKKGFIELYDLLRDKGEKINLSNSKPKISERFKKDLKFFLKTLPSFSLNLQRVKLKEEEIKNLKNLGYIK